MRIEVNVITGEVTEHEDAPVVVEPTVEVPVETPAEPVVETPVADATPVVEGV